MQIHDYNTLENRSRETASCTRLRAHLLFRVCALAHPPSVIDYALILCVHHQRCTRPVPTVTLGTGRTSVCALGQRFRAALSPSTTCPRLPLAPE